MSCYTSNIPRVPETRPRTVEIWKPGEGPPDIFEAYPIAAYVWQDTAGRLFVSIDGDKDPAPYEPNEWRSFVFIDEKGHVRVEVFNVRLAALEKRNKKKEG